MNSNQLFLTFTIHLARGIHMAMPVLFQRIPHLILNISVIMHFSISHCTHQSNLSIIILCIWPICQICASCEDAVGTAKESIMVNISTSGISNAGQDPVTLVFNPTVSTNGMEDRSLTIDSQTSWPEIVFSPNLHISTPKAILHWPKYSRQDWIKNP